MSSLLIRGGHVFDLELPFERADVLVVDGEIARVGPGQAGEGDVVLEAEGMIVMPGLINAHTHSNQTIERGLSDRLPLDAWMVLASYGGAGARLSPRDLYVSAGLGALEMLRTGTTSVLDCARVDREWFAEGMDAVASAYVDSGMRAAVAAQYADLDFFSSIPLEVLDRASIPRRPPTPRGEVLGEVEEYLDRWVGRHPLVAPMIGPSSLPRCSDELFEASVELAERKGVKLQTHLLSAKSQVLVAEERFGGSTVGHLEELGSLKPWASFAHGIWVDEEEISLLAASPSVVVHNPVSNLKLGAGLAPAPALARAGGTVALGTDGASSNDSQSMFETVKMAALVHRVRGVPDLWPSAMEVLEWCWRGGARALGAPVGRVEPGFRADLVLLATGELLPGPKEQVAHQLVYGEIGRSVQTVLVDGEPVVREGRVTSLDEVEVEGEARKLADRIWSGLPDRLQRFEEVRADLERLERAVYESQVGFTRFCDWTGAPV